MKYASLILGFALAMPILGAQDASAPLRSKEESQSVHTKATRFEDFGRELGMAWKMGYGPSFDVAVEGKLLYSIGSGSLRIADISSEPGKPKPLGCVKGLGEVRQLVVHGGFAFVSARADGVFIVDVRDPAKPFIASHYDSVELATGIAAAGSLLFIANRDFGVEIVDISDPKKPVHLSSVLTGEAQSIDVDGNYLYAGVWGTAQLVVVDISNPRKPVIVAKADLDGFGDGVFIKGHYAYAATGHHKPSWRKTARKPDSPGYGEGHGLEIFDISNPANPKFMSRIKFPPFYELYPDTWKVTVSGRYAFCVDSYNGLFVVDVGDPMDMKPLAFKRLDVNQKFKKNEPVVGAAAGDGYVYAAGYYEDLYVLEAQGLSVKEEHSLRTPPPPPPAEKAKAELKGCRIFKPGGQIYGIDFVGDVCIAAAGQDGIISLRVKPAFKELSRQKTQGTAFSVCAVGKRVYAAEGMAGLSIWDCDDNGTLTLVGRYVPETANLRHGFTVKQISISKSTHFATIQIGCDTVEIIDVSTPENPKKVLSKKFPIMYGDQLCLGTVAGRYSCSFSHMTGVAWFDLEAAGGPAYIGTAPSKGLYKAGLTAFGDKLLMADPKGGYFLVSKEDKSFEGLKSRRLASGVTGMPSVFGNILFLAERSRGKVFVVDVSDIDAPKLDKEINTAGNPGRAVIHDGCLLIPDGYEGLLAYDGFPSKP